jgi:hypothetical protein
VLSLLDLVPAGTEAHTTDAIKIISVADDLAEVKAFNAIAGIGEVIGLLVSLAAGTLWAAIVLRIERNQAALLAGR